MSCAIFLVFGFSLVLGMNPVLRSAEEKYVVVQYGAKVYPGKVVSGPDEMGDIQVSAMAKKGKFWCWPHPPDVIWYKKKTNYCDNKETYQNGPKFVSSPCKKMINKNALVNKNNT